jgi:hypothetical protein
MARIDLSGIHSRGRGKKGDYLLFSVRELPPSYGEGSSTGSSGSTRVSSAWGEHLPFSWISKRPSCRMRKNCQVPFLRQSQNSRA